MSNDRITVWYLIGTLSVGGTEQTLVDLADNLDKDRFEVTVWTLADPGPLASELSTHVELKSLNAKSKMDVRAPLRFVRALRRDRPDIVQSFLFYDNVFARLTGIISPNTTIITGVRSVPNDPSIIRSIVDRATIPLSDRIVSNSEAGAEFIVDRGADPDQVEVVYNGRDQSEYSTATTSPDLRSQLNIPSEAPVVGTVGRLIERKGHYDLLEAWPAVIEEHSSAYLLIVGDGPEREALLDRVKDHGVANSVYLLGYRDDVPELLDLMDVFVFPSHFEGSPGALLEAMAAGLPIVTTPVDGNSELVKHGKTGLYAPTEAPIALAEQINRLLSDSEHASKLGDRAATVATEQFTLEEMVSNFESLYVESI